MKKKKMLISPKTARHGALCDRRGEKKDEPRTSSSGEKDDDGERERERCARDRSFKMDESGGKGKETHRKKKDEGREAASRGNFKQRNCRQITERRGRIFFSTRSSRLWRLNENEFHARKLFAPMLQSLYTRGRDIK